jgi:hypothetical protein
MERERERSAGDYLIIIVLPMGWEGLRRTGTGVRTGLVEGSQPDPLLDSETTQSLRSLAFSLAQDSAIPPNQSYEQKCRRLTVMEGRMDARRLLERETTYLCMQDRQGKVV